MGKVLITGGGGAGGMSDDMTAANGVTADLVPKGQTYIGADTDDEIGTGTMDLAEHATVTPEHVVEGDKFYNNNSQLPDKPNTGTMKRVKALDDTNKVRINGNYLVLGMTNGAHIDNNSDVTIGVPEVQAPFDKVRGALQINAKDISCESTIAGLKGTYTGWGSATTAEVLAGKTFSNATATNLKGTIADRGTNQTAGGIGGGQSAGYVAFNQIPQGYYHRTDTTGNGWWQPEVRIAETTLRNWAVKEYGISPDKIAYGCTVMGVKGKNAGGIIVNENSPFVSNTFGPGYSEKSFGVDPSTSGYGNGYVKKISNYLEFQTATWRYDKAISHGPWCARVLVYPRITLTGLNKITIQASGCYATRKWPVKIEIGNSVGANDICRATFTNDSSLGIIETYEIDISKYNGTGFLSFVFDTSYSEGSDSESYGYWSAKCWIHQIAFS